MAALTDLPDLILDKVFGCLDVLGQEPARLCFSLVCRKFRDLERRRTVLELEGLQGNPVKALTVYPNLTALKVEGSICRKWAAGSFGRVDASQHRLKTLDLNCAGVFRPGEILHGLISYNPKEEGSWCRAEGAPERRGGMLEELTVRGWDGLDLTSMCDSGLLMMEDAFAGALAREPIKKLTLVGHTKNTLARVVNGLRPTLVSLDVSGLKQGRWTDSQFFAGEFVRDPTLTLLAKQCPNLRELYLGQGCSNHPYLKGLEAIAEGCVHLDTLGQSAQRGAATSWDRCEWATDDALAILARKAKSLTRLSWAGSDQLTAQTLPLFTSGLAPRLTSLSINLSSVSSEVGLKQCLGALTGLRDLCIRLRSGLESEVISGMPKLTSLVVLNCETRMADMVGHSCPALEELHFPCGVFSTGLSLSNLFLRCQALTNLSITVTTDSGTSLAALKHLKNLKSLLVITSWEDTRFDDGLLRMLVERNKKLSNLEIRTAGEGLTDDGVSSAVCMSRSLATFIVSWCQALSKDLVISLVRNSTLTDLTVRLSSDMRPFKSADAVGFTKSATRLTLLQWNSFSIKCKYMPWQIQQ